MSKVDGVFAFFKGHAAPQIVSLISVVGVFNLYFALFRSQLPASIRFFFDTSDFLYMNFLLFLSVSVAGLVAATFYYGFLYTASAFILTPRLINRNKKLSGSRYIRNIRRSALFWRRVRKSLRKNSFSIKAGIFFCVFSLFHFEDATISFYSIILGGVAFYVIFFSFYAFSFRISSSIFANRSLLAIFRQPRGVDDLRWWNFLLQAIAFSAVSYSAMLGVLVSKDELNELIVLETISGVNNVTLVRVSSNGLIIRGDSTDGVPVKEASFTFVPKNSILTLRPLILPE